MRMDEEQGYSGVFYIMLIIGIIGVDDEAEIVAMAPA
jgi:hypothetical protein